MRTLPVGLWVTARPPNQHVQQWRRAFALLWLALGLAGCGGAAAPQAQLAPVCPCAISDDFSVDFFSIGGVSYGFSLERQIQYWKEGAHRGFPSGLDQTLCFGGGPTDKHTWLHIAGCRGAYSVVRTFRNETGAREADIFVGEYELPPHVRLIALDRREDGVVFAIDEASSRILRLQDDDGDGCPDRHETYAQAESHLLTEGHDLYTTRSGLVVVTEQGCVPGDAVFVVEDRNRDGRPEWFGETSSRYLHEGGPKSARPIQVPDRTIELIAGVGSRVELWESDAAGQPLSSDPGESLLGQTDPEARAWNVVSLRRSLRQGMYVCAYDTQYKRWGPPHIVHASFPRVLDHGPKAIDGSVPNEVSLAVQGLTEETRVVLASGKLEEALLYEHLRDDIIRVRVPALDRAWQGRATLRVLGPRPPANALHPRISISFPD